MRTWGLPPLQGVGGGDGGERDWDGGRFGAGEWRESGNRKRVREPAASSTSLSRHASSSSCASSSRRRRRSSCYRTRRKLCGCDVCCVRKVWHYIMYCHLLFFSRGDGLFCPNSPQSICKDEKKTKQEISKSAHWKSRVYKLLSGFLS